MNMKKETATSETWTRTLNRTHKNVDTKIPGPGKKLSYEKRES